MDDYDPEERERPSWREIDAKRDRSRHVASDPTSTPQRFPKKRQDAAAKRALHEFFSEKKSKEQESDWKKTAEASGRAFCTRAKTYVEKYGWPRQWDDLLRLLDHSDPTFLVHVLDRMMESSAFETPTHLDLGVGKLRILKMICEDPRVLERIHRFLEAHS